MSNLQSVTTAPHPQRWSILAAVLSLLIMAPLDASATNIIMPILQREFHLALTHVAWVALIYLLVLATLILPMGRIGDVFGFRRLYLFGAMLFVVASVCCGLAPAFGWLLAGRVLQAMGACMMMALSSGIATALFPAAERGRALGTVGMVVAAGQVLGPTVGGLLTHLLGWRWIFFINAPIGVIGGFFCLRLLPTIRTNKGSIRMDWSGTLLAMGALGAFVLALTQGETWGWRSPAVLVLAASSMLGVVAFISTERRALAPMLDLSLFRHPVFVGANIGLLMNFLGQFSAAFLVPKLLIDGLGLSIAHTGLIMIVLPCAVLIVAPISGGLSDRVGTRLLATMGETLVAVGLAGLAFSALHHALPAIIAAMALLGIGAGLFQSPNNSAIMGSVPRTHLGVGGGVLATMRNLGMAMGITISSVIATTTTRGYLHLHPTMASAALLHGIASAFLLGAAFAALGALTSAVRADHPRG